MQAGYDKIKLWIDRTIAGEQYPAIVNYLDGARQVTDLVTGEVKTFGNLEGLKVSVSVGGLSVIGSLAKFLFGNNVYPLDRRATAQALEKLGDALHIQVSKANVTGLEFGANFPMKHPVTDYLARLGVMPRLERVQVTPNSLRYEGRGKQQPKVFAFYDKTAEAKGIECLNELANLLRYEIRLNGRVPYQLSVPDVKASALYELSFYRVMAKYYQDSYYSISKLNQIKTNVMNEIKTPTDAFNVLVARLISQTDQSQIVGFLEELKQAGVFEDRKNYTRLRKKIEEVAAKANISISDELIKELDNEIKNSVAYV